MNIGKIALTFFLCVLSFLKPVKHLSILLLKLLLRKKIHDFTDLDVGRANLTWCVQMCLVHNFIFSIQ